MRTSKQPRVAIFGVGRMGRVHVENLLQFEKSGAIELVAIGDRFEPALHITQNLIAEFGRDDACSSIRSFSDPTEMAKEVAPDAVVIASRISDHAADLGCFLPLGCPVLVEKPMVGSLQDALALQSIAENVAAQQNDSLTRTLALIHVAFQRYFDPAATLAAQWFTDGRLGHLQQSHHVIQDKNPPHTGYESGGITADMAVHLVFESMQFHNFELPRYVQAIRFLAPYYEDRAHEGANIVHCFLTWQDGSMAHLWGSRLNATGYDNGFKLIGTKGRIDVGEFAGDFGSIHAKLWEGTEDESKLPRGTLTEDISFSMTESSRHHPDFYARYAEAFANELESFIDSVRQGTPPPLGFEIGWKTSFVASLADQSALQNGHRFELSIAGEPIRTLEQAMHWKSFST